jgi:hypothetical protein
MKADDGGFCFVIPNVVRNQREAMVFSVQAQDALGGGFHLN